MIERMPGEQCRSEIYTGQSCMQQLAASQMCTLGSTEPVMVKILGQQQQTEHTMLLNTVLGVVGELYTKIKASYYNGHKNS